GKAITRPIVASIGVRLPTANSGSRFLTRSATSKLTTSCINSDCLVAPPGVPRSRRQLTLLDQDVRCNSVLQRLVLRVKSFSGGCGAQHHFWCASRHQLRAWRLLHA